MKRVIVSGYFSKIRSGHLDLLEGAAKIADYVIVIVNNDKQRMLKVGSIDVGEKSRVRLMNNMRLVNEVVLSIDDGFSVSQTLDSIAQKYPEDELIFANGGDRDSAEGVPEAEVCKKYNIELRYNVGERTSDE